MTVELLPAPDRPGLTVVDRIEGRRFPLTTRRPVDPEPGDDGRFRDPVDAAVRCRVGELELPYVVAAYVRDADGEMIAECHEFADRELPDGEYEVELAAPVKVYLRVAGPLAVDSTSDEMRIAFGERRRVDVGARSFHEHPAATVTTTAAPEDLMAAVSTFGSALKTTSPERSFPSLRGHPPTVELGDALSVPDGVAPPATDLCIEVPRERSAVYAVATLAHYLGARVRPGPEPRLLADGDVLGVLDGPEGLEGAVTETLRHLFLLDCVVRTEGRYRLDLYERRRLEERVDLPLGELYRAPIAERTRRYLDVATETVDDLVPRWTLATHLSPAPEAAELLPYAANALSLIAVQRSRSGGDRSAPPPGYDAFVEADDAGAAGDAADGDRYVHVSGPDAIERAWVGDGRAVNANDLHPAGVRHRLAGESSEGPVEIALVCNDERMLAEIGDGDLYGDREELPFEVAVHREVSCDRLRSLLAEDLDFLHYVGHVERSGLICPDGALDAADLDAVGVDTFFLNGCRSYDQGRLLVEKGGVGGIVTHGAVDDANATAVGRLVAGLLNAGYSLRSALAVAGRGYAVEGRYDVVGDGAVQVAQSESGTPNLISVSETADGYEVAITTYPALGTAMGACYTPHTPSVDRHFLVGGELPPFELSLPEVLNLLSLERVPAMIDGELRWSTDVSPADLP
ncbi:hypothetical protein [Halomicrobium salinisoli]|uniref:hypothetical protein n=1 Tax=Halomicrobium salinisoli TaxID=2878391 RepID=UPI001CF084C5|nr:hypothetical protein [Halomicrobium salinisoli]